MKRRTYYRGKMMANIHHNDHYKELVAWLDENMATIERFLIRFARTFKFRTSIAP